MNVNLKNVFIGFGRNIYFGTKEAESHNQYAIWPRCGWQDLKNHGCGEDQDRREEKKEMLRNSRRTKPRLDIPLNM